MFFYLDIVHRDLKLENILIKEFDPESDTFFIKVRLILFIRYLIFFNFANFKKVTDFGLSSQRETVGTESMFEDYCGTPLYMGINKKYMIYKT